MRLGYGEKKKKKRKIGHTVTKQTSEGGEAKKITRDEELDCWFGAELSISPLDAPSPTPPAQPFPDECQLAPSTSL